MRACRHEGERDGTVRVQCCCCWPVHRGSCYHQPQPDLAGVVGSEVVPGVAGVAGSEALSGVESPGVADARLGMRLGRTSVAHSISHGGK